MPNGFRQNFFVKSNVDLGDGVTKQISSHEAQTGDKAPSNVVGLLERVLVRSRINDDKQPRFLVGRPLGHKDADIVTLMEDGSVRYDGSWKYSPEGRSDANVHEHQSALAKMKKTRNQRCQGCLACEHGITVNLGRKHTVRMSTDNSSLSRRRQLVDGEIQRRCHKVCNVMNMKVMLNTEIQNACISHTNNLTIVQTRS